MHPLGWYATPLGVALLVLAVVWLAFGPPIDYLVQFWPALAIALGIAGVLWAFATERVRTAIEGFLRVPFTRGILIAALLTAVYAGIIAAAYGPGANLLKEQFGVDAWWSRFWVTIAIPFTIPAILRLYAATDLPGDPVQIGRALRVFVVFVLVFLSWLHFDAILGRMKAREWIGGPPAVARPTVDIPRLAVPLQPTEWAPIGHLFPGCTRYTLRSAAGRKDLLVRFADGGEEPLDGRDFSRRDPMAVKSLAPDTLEIWLFDIGKACSSRS